MAAYRRVYDSRHLQADCQEPESTLCSAIGYGLPLPFMPTLPPLCQLWASILRYVRVKGAVA